jgi:hypothetical protein
MCAGGLVCRWEREHDEVNHEILLDNAAACDVALDGTVPFDAVQNKAVPSVAAHSKAAYGKEDYGKENHGKAALENALLE